MSSSPPSLSSPHANKNIYPASFIKKHLVPNADSYRKTLSSLRAMDKDAIIQRNEYWKQEDALVEKAAKLLMSKETSPEDLQKFLASGDFTDLEATRGEINDIRTQTLKLATEAYNKVDDSIQVLDREIGMLEPQMAAAAAVDLSTLDPQILAIKKKEMRKIQREEKQKAKELALKQKNKKGGGRWSAKEGLIVSDLALSGGPAPGEEVDPNEPVYCTCQRVSYGQMVGCDNEDCRYEWFHLECVMLLEPPTGTWYCPDCCALKGLEYHATALVGDGEEGGGGGGVVVGAGGGEGGGGGGAGGAGGAGAAPAAPAAMAAAPVVAAVAAGTAGATATGGEGGGERDEMGV